MKRFIHLILSCLAFSSLIAIQPSKMTSSKKEAFCYDFGYYGVGYDISFLDPDTPLQVSEESINIYVDSQSASTSASKDGDSQIKMDFVINNPTDQEVTTKVALPFKPYNEYDGMSNSTATSYQILCDSKDIETTLNHFYPVNDGTGKFSIPEFTNTMVEDEKYSFDCKIYKRSFKFSADAEDKSTLLHRDYLEFDFSVPKEDEIWFNGSDYSYSSEEGDKTIYTGRISNNSTQDVYFIGQDYTEDFLSDFHLYSYDDSEKVEVTHTIIQVEGENEEYTLRELMNIYRPEHSLVSETDWYNATIYKLNHVHLCSMSLDYFNLANDLLGCFEYSLTVPANSSINHYIYGNILNCHSEYFHFHPSDDKPYEGLKNFNLTLSSDGYFQGFLGSSTVDLDDLSSGIVYPRDDFGFVMNDNDNYADSNALFTGIILMGMLLLGIVGIILLIGLGTFYLVSYFKDKSYYPKNKKGNLTLLLIEGLISAIMYPIFAFVFFNSYSFVGFICAGVLIQSLVLDLIRCIVYKDKIYLPILFLILSIGFFVLYFFKALASVEIALCLCIIYSIYYFVSFITTKQKLMKEASH